MIPSWCCFIIDSKMAWRNKGSSDLIRRGQAFRTVAHDAYETFPAKYLDKVEPPGEAVSTVLVNNQRELVNHLLYPEGEISFRVHLTPYALGAASLWKRLVEEIGESYYPPELLSDSRSAKRQKIFVPVKKSLAELENQDKEGEEEDKEEDPEVGAQSDSSVGADDYNVRLDFEDEGARDDNDDGDNGGGDDYGGEF